MVRPRGPKKDSSPFLAGTLGGRGNPCIRQTFIEHQYAKPCFRHCRHSINKALWSRGYSGRDRIISKIYKMDASRIMGIESYPIWGASLRKRAQNIPHWGMKAGIY